jgi:hypothetical protein
MRIGLIHEAHIKKHYQEHSYWNDSVPVITIIDVGDVVHLGVLCVSSVKFTIRVGSCVHSIPCDILNKLYFFIFTKKIVNGLILELQ